jgi:spermidine/putrescine transport system substrate-binding protein
MESRHVDALTGAISRRRVLQLSAGTAIGAFIAACGTAGTRSPGASGAATGSPAASAAASATAGASETAGATEGPVPTEGATSEPTETGELPPPAQVGGSFKWANWIGYIDVSDDQTTYPTLEEFTAATGVTVEYFEDVDDNESFFASDLKQPLEQGIDTGWDLVVLTDWMVARLIRRGWLEEIDTANTPAFPANLLDQYIGREFDPETKFAAPWQSGMTGIGFDQAQTGPIESLEALWDPTYAQRITYLTEMRDTIGLAALKLGLVPEELTEEGFQAALAEVRRGVDEGIARELTGNYYVNVMARGNAVLAMAWSGDIAGLLVPDQEAGQDFQWVLPTEGGMLWTDNMVIPKGAANKRQAEAWIDYYYRPQPAAQIEAYVNYVCPVKGAREEIVAIDPALAENTLIFPSEEMVARLHQSKTLDGDTEQRWQEAFNDAVGL